jgi:hypothetical protein
MSQLLEAVSVLLEVVSVWDFQAILESRDGFRYSGKRLDGLIIEWC